MSNIRWVQIDPKHKEESEVAGFTEGLFYEVKILSTHILM